MDKEENTPTERTENNIGDARRRYEDIIGKRFTQKDAAEYFCVSIGAYRNWEQGVGKGLKGKQLKEIADKYQTTTDYLLRLTDNPSVKYAYVALPDALSDEERELVDVYRSMTSEGRRQALEYVKYVAKNHPKNQVDNAKMA